MRYTIKLRRNNLIEDNSINDANRRINKSPNENFRTEYRGKKISIRLKLIYSNLMQSLSHIHIQASMYNLLKKIL